MKKIIHIDGQIDGQNSNKDKLYIYHLHALYNTPHGFIIDCD